MMRALGLDVGSKTIGTAISDERQRMAFPGETIIRQEGWRKDMAAIRDLVADKGVGLIVVGIPVMMDGSEGIQAEKVRDFVSTLRRNVRIPIAFQDERMSTREAERLLYQAGRDHKEVKKVVDSVAACLILQAYLDKNESASDRVAHEEKVRV